MKNRILIVEDDHAISDAVALNMQFIGYGYAVFDDGKKATAPFSCSAIPATTCFFCSRIF